LFALLLLCGWNVLFIALIYFIVIISPNLAAKLLIFFEITKKKKKFSKNIYVFYRKKRNFAPDFSVHHRF